MMGCPKNWSMSKETRSLEKRRKIDNFACEIFVKRRLLFYERFVIVVFISLQKSTAMIHVEHYNPTYKEDFIRLNREWIERWFEIESSDLKTFETVDDIVKNGSQIFLAIDDENRCVGCCALIHHQESNRYELAKMAVSETCQGQGVGKKLMESLISYADAIGVKSIFLEGNTKLEASIHLYQSFGFQQVPIIGSRYDRCNILMEKSLDEKSI